MIRFSRDNVDPSGTCLIGYLRTTYENLVKIFGKDDGPGDKSAAEWALEIYDMDDEGTRLTITIYDHSHYETSPPLGEYDWHVGGYDRTDLFPGKVTSNRVSLW